MNIIVICSYGDPQYPLTDDIVKSLNDQKVSFDNWKLLLFIPIESCEPITKTKLIEVSPEQWAWTPVTELRPADYYVVKMIESPFKVRWHQDIEFYGSKWVLAVQYYQSP